MPKKPKGGKDGAPGILRKITVRKWQDLPGSLSELGAFMGSSSDLILVLKNLR